MKKLMIIAAMMVATLSANAQFYPGTFSIQPKMGGVGSMLSNTPDNLGTINSDKTANGGFLIGAEAEYQLTNMFSVAAGVNFSQQGTAWDDITASGVKYKDIKCELEYFNIPIVANAYLFKGFALKTGVQFGFLTSANYKYTSEKNGTKTDVETKNKDDFEKFDVSIPIGVSYQFKVPIVIDARFNIGLTSVNKSNKFTSKSMKNEVFQLTVGYKFKL